MKEKITIIFAYRNRDLNRIRISMDSLVKQTQHNFRVLFIDYGSSVAYSEPVQNLITSYPFAQYHYVAHPGLLWNKSKAFNYGILRTETDYVLTADVDLIFNPESIAVIEELVDASSFTLFNYGYLSKSTTAELENITSFDELIPSHFGSTNGVGLYPSKALKQIHGFDEFFHFYGSEDVDLFQRLENAGYKRGHEEKNLFLHQWHPRYPRRKEEELTLVPRLQNILRINQQHYFRCIELNKVIPEKQKEWGICFSREDSKDLKEPTHIFRVSNHEAAVIHFLNEHLPSCEEGIIAVNFTEDLNYLSLKNRVKKIIGRSVQKYFSMKEVNDEVLKKIVFDYRHHNYSYSIVEDLKQISFIIDLRGEKKGRPLKTQ